MSRTKRRTCADLIRRKVGNNPSAARIRGLIHWRYADLPDEQAYACSRAHLHRDRKLYCNGGVPNAFINLYVTRPERRRTKAELHHCQRNDTWEAMLPANDNRQFRPFYW